MASRVRDSSKTTRQEALLGEEERLSAGILRFHCIIRCCVFGKEEKSPVGTSNESFRAGRLRLHFGNAQWGVATPIAVSHCSTAPGSYRYQVCRRELLQTEIWSNFVQNPNKPRAKPLSPRALRSRVSWVGKQGGGWSWKTWKPPIFYARRNVRSRHFWQDF